MAMSDGAARLEAFLDKHLGHAWTGNLEALAADYADDAIVFTPEGPVRGREAIREFLARFMANKPKGFPEDIRFMRRDCGNGTIYIVWSCGPDVPYATETFVVRDGTITAQTFVSCPFLPRPGG